MSKGLNVFVNIGARLLPSLNASARAAENRISAIGRRFKIVSAEAKIAAKEVNAAGAGLAGMAAAGGLTFGVTKAIGEGARLGHELQMLRNTGRTAKEVAIAVAQANRTVAALPTTTVVDNIRALNESVGAFGNFKHAVDNLTFNQKVGSMMKNMLGTDYDAGHSIAAGIRALEIRGTAMNPAKYQKEMGELYKSMIFFRERFSPDELAGFAKTGNLPIKGYNTRFLTRILPSIIQEMGGGDVAGTQAAAFRNQIMGRVPLGGKKLTAEWVRLGLVPPNGTGGNLSKTGWTAGSVKGHKLATEDPFAWVEQVLLPAMKSKGVDINDTNAVLTQISKMFGRETAMRFVSTMADRKQRYRLHQDEANINQVQPLDKAYAETLRNDPVMAWGAIKASFSNLSAAIFGGSAKDSPVAVAMTNIARGINSVAATLRRHPWLAKGIGALLLGGAGIASLKLLGIGLRWVLAPLRMLGGVWRLMFAAVGAAGPRVPWITRIGRGLVWLWGIAARGAAFLGPMLLRGLVAAAPWVLRGLTLMLNPVGAAVAIGAAAAYLIYKYRAAIGSFLSSSWASFKSLFTGYDWRGIGTQIAVAIADGLTFGLASRMPAIASGLGAWWRGNMPTMLGGAAANVPKPGAILQNVTPITRGIGPRPLPAPVFDGHGPRPLPAEKPAARVVVPHSEVQRARAAKAGGDVHIHGGVHVTGAHDPKATAHAVRHELKRIAAGQSAMLSD